MRSVLFIILMQLCSSVFAHGLNFGNVKSISLYYYDQSLYNPSHGFWCENKGSYSEISVREDSVVLSNKQTSALQKHIVSKARKSPEFSVAADYILTVNCTDGRVYDLRVNRYTDEVCLCRLYADDIDRYYYRIDGIADALGDLVVGSLRNRGEKYKEPYCSFDVELIFRLKSNNKTVKFFRDSCVIVGEDGTETRCKDADAVRRCFLIINSVFLNRRMFYYTSKFELNGMLSVSYKERNGKEKEIQPRRITNCWGYYDNRNKQIYKLFAILRTIE